MPLNRHRHAFNYTLRQEKSAAEDNLMKWHRLPFQCHLQRAAALPHQQEMIRLAICCHQPLLDYCCPLLLSQLLLATSMVELLGRLQMLSK